MEITGMGADSIHIALAADVRFYPGLYMTACSIARFCSPGYTLVFHVLDGGIGEENRLDLRRSLDALYSSVKIDWLEIDTRKFADLPSWRGAGKMAWARLLLPRLLSDVNWVLYLDTDFLFFSDVSRLWRLRDDKYSLMGVKDTWYPVYESEKRVFEQTGLVFDAEKYICSGLCFFNLDRIRNLEIDRLWFRYAEANKNLFDQTIINMSFSGREDLFLLKSNWQTFTRDMTYDDLLGRPVLHFAGDAPWVCFPVNHIFNDAAVLWFRIYARFRGISYWKALRTFYSVPQIIFYRAIYLLFSRVRVFRKLLHAFFRMEGHHDSIVIYDALLHPVKLPPVSCFFEGESV